ncbi:hypothetical protein TRFO_30613 [Tritrichomonas foetus]|uniref:Uncharacterized protein n=1 Tax=Tritrichomonas foetus TaxID=1144522 RepID=A0A1J4JU99_9EUKA|nr:hypothetical protein TRFO_30613 [Tritrichomonas foetus]|eukprot:OHT02290.1 hypothetical protein TRFO_30613 [Tritrichomonas foetus]
MKRLGANSLTIKMRAFAHLDFVQTIEDILFVASSHSVANIIVSIIFYLFLILDSILLIVRSGSTARTNKFNAYDVIFYLTTFTLENPTLSEINIVRTTTLVFLICYFIIVLVIIILKVYDFPFLRSLFVFLAFYTIPCTFPALFNSIMITYEGVSNYDLLSSVIFFLHCFLVLFIGFIISVSLFSPMFMNHPFNIVRPTQSAIFFTYIIIYTHTIISEEPWVVYLRVICACLVFIYCLVQPPYLSRIENFLLYTFLTIEIFTCFLYLFVEHRSERLQYLSYSIPICIAFSLLLVFFIFPFLVFPCGFIPKEITAFYSNNIQKCKSMIESMNVSDVSQQNSRILIIISLYLRCNNTFDLVSLYQQRLTHIYESIFIWITNSRLNSWRDCVSSRLLKQAHFFENRIQENTEKFWANVLHSNINILPEIASQIGRDRYRLLKYSCFLSRKFPTINFPREITERNKQGFCFKFVNNLNGFDFLLFLSFCCFLIGHALILAAGTQYSDFIQKFFVVRNFATGYLVVLSDVWEETLRPNITGHWGDMMRYYKEFMTFGFTDYSEPLRYLVGNFTIIAPKLEDYIHYRMINDNFEFTAQTFPFSESTTMLQILDETFIYIYNIFTDLTQKQIIICNIYIFSVLILFPIVLIFAIIAYIIALRRRTILFFESFRTVNKTAVSKLCTNLQTKTAHRKRFHFCRSLPAVTTYVTFLIVSIFILILLLFFNQQNDDFNHNEIRYITYGFSEIQRIDIWLDSIVTHYAFKDFNSSYSSISQISLITCDRIIDKTRRNATLQEFSVLISDELLDNIGAYLISDEMAPYSSWQRILYDSLNRTYYKFNDFNYLTHFHVARFLVFFVCAFVVYSWIIYILLEITPFYKAEQKEFLLKAEEANIIHQFRLQKVKDSQFPLQFYQVDENLRILFASNSAKKDYQVGSKLKLNGMIKTEIEKMKSDTSQNYQILKTGDSTIYLVPTYDFTLKRVDLDSVLIINRNDIKSNITKESYYKLFYNVYPLYTDINSTFPIVLDSSMKQFLILLLKIKGFNEWAETQPADVVCNYRRQLSQLVFEKCRDNEYFCRIRELSDTIVMAMRHDIKAVTLMWRIIEFTSSFANELLKLIYLLNNDFGVDFKVLVMLYKTVEPKTLLGNLRMQQADFKSDAISRAEEFSKNCINGAINYTSQNIERMMVPSTTKVKTSYTANGEMYEISLVV